MRTVIADDTTYITFGSTLNLQRLEHLGPDLALIGYICLSTMEGENCPNILGQSSSHSHPSPGVTSESFFQLPRELRDEIYRCLSSELIYVVGSKDRNLSFYGRDEPRFTEWFVLVM
jgi:hypothetical protein